MSQKKIKLPKAIKENSIQVFSLVFILIMVIPISAEATSTITPSVNYVTETYGSVDTTVTFNYTTISGAPMLKTLKVSRDISQQKATAIGASAQGYFYATSTAINSQTQEQVFDRFAGDVPRYYTQSFFNGTVTYLNSTQINESVIDATPINGQIVTALFPDANSIMYDWCRKNSAIPGVVLNHSVDINTKSDKVKSIMMGLTEPLTPDSNLDDGYDAVPQNASLSPFTYGILVGAGIIAAISTVIIFLLLFALSGNEVTQTQDQNQTGQSGDNINQFNTTTTIIINQTGPSMNDTYNTYVNLCNASGITPTVEGFLDFYERTHPQPQVNVSYLYSINQTTGEVNQSQSARQASAIGLLINDIVSYVIIAVIIISIIITVFLFIKAFRKKKQSDYGGNTIINMD